MDFSFFVANILPVITAVGIAVIGYVLTGLNKRIDRVEKRQDRVDDDLKKINSRLGKIEGLLEGYFARNKD
jgi:hypothetical protein